jgi:hypothetical protein
VSERGPLRCPRCNASVAADQEYCLECGNRLAHHERSGTARRDPWVVPVLLGLVMAVLGTGAAIAISGEREEPNAVSTATGGNLTVTDDGSTLTAPEQTATAPRTKTAPRTTTPKRANPAAITWPRGRRGWTIVLVSLPQAGGLAAATAKAAQARGSGLRRVGILDSGRYASLHPGYYVLFFGVFDSEAEAASALQRARAVFPAAYQREIIP